MQEGQKDTGNSTYTKRQQTYGKYESHSVWLIHCSEIITMGVCGGIAGGVVSWQKANNELNHTNVINE